MTSLKDEVPRLSEAQKIKDEAAVAKLVQLLQPACGTLDSFPGRLQVKSYLYSPAHLRREAHLTIEAASYISLIGERLELLEIAQDLMERADQLEREQRGPAI